MSAGRIDIIQGGGIHEVIVSDPPSTRRRPFWGGRRSLGDRSGRPDTRPPWLRWQPLPEGQGCRFLVNANSRALARLAWARAADTMALRPPVRPRLEPAGHYRPILDWFWPHWLRITTHLAIVQPEALDFLAPGLVSDSPDDIISSLSEVLRIWEQMHLRDFRALCHRSRGAGLEGRGLPEGSDRRRGWSLLPEVGDVEGLLALARGFAWRKGIGDARGGWLESRWVQWPAVGPPRLSIHLSHPATGHAHPEYALLPLARPRFAPSARPLVGEEIEAGPRLSPDPLTLNGG